MKMLWNAPWQGHLTSGGLPVSGRARVRRYRLWGLTVKRWFIGAMIKEPTEGRDDG